MKTNAYLAAAYVVTWLIHIGYLITLMTRYSRLKKDIEELKRK